jgi:hypothetical protein
MSSRPQPIPVDHAGRGSLLGAREIIKGINQQAAADQPGGRFCHRNSLQAKDVEKVYYQKTKAADSDINHLTFPRLTLAACFYRAAKLIINYRRFCW